MNPLVDDGRHPRALLALEDGTCFLGRSTGAEGETFGEVVFNTSMVGYQEIVSDPSYAGQIVTFTYPQLGNYGINEIDMQASELALRGLVCHDMCYTPSNWQSVVSFPDFLRERGIVGAARGVHASQQRRHVVWPFAAHLGCATTDRRRRQGANRRP